MTTFGARLRALRQKAGLSQVELAGDDLSPSYISLLESGKRMPSTEAAAQLASRLGCSTAQLLDGRPSERDQRLELELAYARLAIEHGEAADAAARMRRLLVEPDLDQVVRDDASLQLARACQRLGDTEGAVLLLEDLFTRASEGTAGLPFMHIAMFLSHCYREVGDLHRASRLGERAMEAARAQGLDGTDDYFELAASVMFTYTEMGDFLFARALAQRLITEAEAKGRPSGQAALYWNAAVLAEYEGRMADAVELSRRALARMGELESTRDFARLRMEVAGILLASEDPAVDEARRLLDQSLSDLRDLGGRLDLAEWMCVRSTVDLHGADVVMALERAREAVALSEGHVGPVSARALHTLADAQRAVGAQDAARQALSDSEAHLEALGGSRPIGLLWRELAERYADLGDHARAAEAFRRALDNGGIRDRSSMTRRAVRACLEAAALGSASTPPPA